MTFISKYIYYIKYKWYNIGVLSKRIITASKKACLYMLFEIIPVILVGYGLTLVMVFALLNVCALNDDWEERAHQGDDKYRRS